MASQEQVNVRELIRAHRATRNVSVVTEKDGEEDRELAKKADTRFLQPGARKPIKEDSGTYSVIFKKP